MVILFKHLVSTLLNVAIFVLMHNNATTVIAQTATSAEFRVIHANSKTVKIKDGNHPEANDWVLDPSIELDTYFSIRSDERRTITFTTDIDSAKFDVEPDREYDFVIMLKDVGACKTRISTKLRSFTRSRNVEASAPLIIPVTIEGGKLHLKGRINNSETLDLIFDTGADACLIYPSAKSKNADLQVTSSVMSSGTGGTDVRKVSDGNQLSIADATWQHESFIFVERQADDADGLVGFNVFSNKILELDYDRMLMIVYDALPEHARRFSVTPLKSSGTLPAVDVTMTSAGLSCNGPFILDTAGTSCMLVNQAFSGNHDLYGKLKKVGTGKARGIGSKTIILNQLMLPSLSIAGHSLTNVPIHVEVPSNGIQAPPGGVICMDVLSRFNTILDFKAKQAYFRPNSHFSEAFRVRGNSLSAALVGGIILIGVFLVGIGVFFRQRFGVIAKSPCSTKRSAETLSL